MIVRSGVFTSCWHFIMNWDLGVGVGGIDVDGKKRSNRCMAVLSVFT